MNHQQIGDDAEEGRDDAFAIAEQQVAVSQRAAPAILFPALQGNAQRPACPLPVSGTNGIGEKFAHAQRHGDGDFTIGAKAEPLFPVSDKLHREARENRTHAESGQTRADVIILGQAFCVEWVVVGLFKQREYRQSRKTRAHAGRRDGAG